MIRPAIIFLAMVCPAFAGQTVIHKSPAPPVLQMCLDGMRAAQSENATLRAQIEAMKAELASARTLPPPEPPKAATASPKPAKATKRTRCKKGRTRNAKGICGRW